MPTGLDDWNNCADCAIAGEHGWSAWLKGKPKEEASRLGRFWTGAVVFGRNRKGFFFGTHHVLKLKATDIAKHCGYEDLYYDGWNPPGEKVRDQVGRWADFVKKYSEIGIGSI